MEQTMSVYGNHDCRDTVVAVATPYGTGGIAVIRLSGPDAVAIADSVWKGARLAEVRSHTMHLGTVTDSDGSALDEAVAAVMRGPRSFTGEDTVEFSVHGSKWIQREVVRRLVEAGARAAGPGEFSQRAFLNGRIDLAQAEGIADLIGASSRAAHRLAMTQLRGEFSSRLDMLRERLVEFASLLELELDFSEEDVTFADRDRLRALADEIIALLRRLVASYASGRAFKEGVPVVIAGAPNAGKSTLLNRLVDDDRAIVSDIPGTTRDVIEDTCEIGGVLFRFYDTAGLRDTSDTVENIGIERAMDRIRKAAIVLWMVDMSDDVTSQLAAIAAHVRELPETVHFIIGNKSDIAASTLGKKLDAISAPAACVGRDLVEEMNAISAKDVCVEKDLGEDIDCGKVQYFNISAKEGTGVEELCVAMVEKAKRDHDPDTELIVTNARHHAALKAGLESLERAREALDAGISADFIAQDVRESLHHLGTVTGAVTTDTLLTSIFTRFCIGK